MISLGESIIQLMSELPETMFYRKTIYSSSQLLRPEKYVQHVQGVTKINLSSANPTKWSNIQTIRRQFADENRFCGVGA